MSKIGRKWTKEQKEKHSKIFKGRVITPEWRKKLSEANKDKIGKKAPGYKHGKYVLMGALRRNAPPKPKACESCGILEKDLKLQLCIDHNHKTGEFRGWLCHGCNVALGFVNDRVYILIALINYLTKTKTD